MLVHDEIEVSVNGSTIRWYKLKGYEIPTHKVQLWANKGGKKVKNGTKNRVRQGTKIVVKVCDLPPGSNERILIKCPNCGVEYSIIYQSYLGKYSDNCTDCVKRTIKGDGSHSYWVQKLIAENDDAKCDISGETDKRFLALHHLLPIRLGGKNTPDNYVVLSHNYHYAFHTSLGATYSPCDKNTYVIFKEKEVLT